MLTNLIGSDSSPEADSTSISESQTITNVSDSITPTSAKKTKFSWYESIGSYWKKLSLQPKVTLFSLAIGIIPVAVVGGVAYKLAANSLMQQIIADQESRTFDIGQKVSLVTNHMISDANTVAHSPLLTDRQFSSSTSSEQKIALLNDFIDKHPLEKYDSVAVFDPEGNLLVQSSSPKPLNPQENYGNHDYFQRAIATKAPAVNDPEIHSASGNNSLQVAAPIKDNLSGEVVGILRLRMPLNHWRDIFQYIQAEGWEYKLIDTEGFVFDSDEAANVGRPVGSDLLDMPQLMARIASLKNDNQRQEAIIATSVMGDRDDRESVLVSVAPIANVKGVMASGWEIALSRPLEDAFAPLRQLRMALMLGAGGTALLVGAVATTVANGATKPILEAAVAVKKIGRGELNTQLDVQGHDEIAALGFNINKMAQKLKALVQYKAAEAQRSQGLKDLTLKLSRAANSEEVFQMAVKEILLTLKVDRAIIYSLEGNGPGKIVAESVVARQSSLLRAEKPQLEYLDQYIANNRFGKVQAISNIYQADLDIAHLKQLEASQVKAELIAPFSTGKKSKNLLIVHQCNHPRQWHRPEIDFFAQLTSQVVLAWERTHLLQQQRFAREDLQHQALSLLTEVEPISQGDLTTHATVTEGEIGTIADSYNSTVENLRHIVVQVQQSVTKMASATSNSEGFAVSLSQRATQQSEAIGSALAQIQNMAESIQAVASNAEHAETTFQEVLQTVVTGDAAMDRTVAGILAIRETVAETSKKVKRLGESSQKISKVVNLIGSFAAQTNLLALNASLEASRAGEEEHNFAIVAEEIRALAQQSAEATSEIEKIVASIQLDTREVAKAMEEGIERVVIGTQLVDETRQSLNQIASSSKLVNDWISTIAQETVQESQASQKITQIIAEVADMANTTSTDAAQVSFATKQLLSVASDLQSSVSRFKV